MNEKSVSEPYDSVTATLIDSATRRLRARIAVLERKNAALGVLAAGGAPEGYVLVKAETL